MRVADLIWQRLAKEVEIVFYLPGGMCGPLVDSLGQSGLRAVCCLHEAGAGWAAVAYAQHRGFGVALSTSGPGATNLMTPCLAAWMDSVPVLFISGQCPSKQLAPPGMRTRGTQEGPTIAMVKPITKFCHLMLEPLDGLELAIEQAKSSRMGPTWIDVPLEIQGANYE